MQGKKPLNKRIFIYKIILSVTDITEQIEQTLSNVTEGVCHPLKVRVEHILAADAGATVLYSITSLIHFYQQVIGQVGIVHLLN
jgi:hypothetical protein